MRVRIELLTASAKKEKHPGSHTSESNDSTAVDNMQARQPNAGVMGKFTVDINDIVPEKPVVQNNLNQCNKEDIPLSGTEIEMESYGQESPDSSDEEWSAFSTPRKAKLQENETASLPESLRPATRCSRRAQVTEQNDEHTSQSEKLHGSASEQRTEVLCSNGSSSKASKYHFGPIVSQKLKVYFEKDPYPCRATKESLAQELGLTFNQVSKWFSATRHYSRGAAAKNKKQPDKSTSGNNNSTTFYGIQVREPNVGLMEKTAADTNDMIPEKLMVQINLNEGIEEDIPPGQYNMSEERVAMTPTAISMEAVLPGYGAGENFFQFGSSNTSCEQSAIMVSNTISREVSPRGYAPGANQGDGASRNTSCQQRPVMSPTTISREVGPPGYERRENQCIDTPLNTHCEQGVFMSPVTMSREVGPPGYGPVENQDTGNTSCELRMFTSPTATVISREAGLPGYELGENQGTGASWNNSYEHGVFSSPTTVSREAGPPGFGSGENQGNDTSVFISPSTISREVTPPGQRRENQCTVASWTSYEQGVFRSPTTISREVGLPGYGPGENQGNVASRTTTCRQRMFTSPTTVSSEVGPPGYSPIENQGIGGSRNMSFEQRVVMTPPTISKEVFPPGYGPGENQGSNLRSPQGRSAGNVEFSEEARKKAIQRELRRRQKFR